MGLVGADADALDQLARMVEDEAAALEELHRGLTRKLHSSPWEGPGADRFRTRWTGEHARQVHQAAEFLRSNGQGLREHARQQRDASGSSGGTTGWTTSAPATMALRNEDLHGWVADMREFLGKLGLPLEKINQVLGLLEMIDPSIRDQVVDLLGGDAFTDFLGMAGSVLGLAGNVVDFVDAFASQPDLPFDEALVYAAGTMAIGFAVSTGIEFVASKLGAAIGTVLFPGGGTVAGHVIGQVVGIGLEKGVEVLDDKFDLTEKGAMGMVEVYREAKELAANADEVLTAIGDGVDQAVDVALDVGGDVIDGIGEGVREVGENLPDWMMPWNL